MKFYQYMQSLGAQASLTAHGSRPACYCTSVPLLSVLNTPDKLHEAIRLAALESQRGMLLLSVTEQDTHHKMWLEELKGYEGVTIAETVSRFHGDFKCWLACLPIHDN